MNPERPQARKQGLGWTDISRRQNVGKNQDPTSSLFENRLGQLEPHKPPVHVEKPREYIHAQKHDQCIEQ